MRAMAGERHRPGIQCLRNARPPRKVLHMSLQALSASVALWLTLCGPALAQDNDPDASPIWQKIRADLFGGTRIESGEQMLMLETPRRAEDAAIVRLKYVEGLTNADIERAIGTKGVTTGRLQNILGRLRSALQSAGIDARDIAMVRGES